MRSYSRPKCTAALARNLLSMAFLLGLNLTASADEPKVGEAIPRKGDEIVVCGQLFHTTAPVVLWMDPGGFDAYRVENRFARTNVPPVRKGDSERTPNRYGRRKVTLTPEQAEQVHGGGWDLPLLQSVVDQFVIHFDVAGTSKKCFEVLHDHRNLSVHFMLDVDGTIYQSLDLKEGAWHATISNGRSIGIEIANVGAYPVKNKSAAPVFSKWYRKDDKGGIELVLPEGQGHRASLGKDWVARPSRPEPVVGMVQGQELEQYDLTPEQYDSLIKLTATLCKVFPKIKCDYPRDASGKLVDHKLPEADFKAYEGVLGHYHVQTNKVDPGPAFQWDKVIDGARALMAK
ncbi:N-acetylmuramoyl-L-alanine amidase [Singulisphaera sp. PoT]|uniref:N-acetylmuramoyl-L-alanine amidase n=1 Tax=Singulisphaera sp. PoT TaxID=3411797 RepID=UPI003BF520BA